MQRNIQKSCVLFMDKTFLNIIYCELYPMSAYIINSTSFAIQLLHFKNTSNTEVMHRGTEISQRFRSSYSYVHWGQRLSALQSGMGVN